LFLSYLPSVYLCGHPYYKVWVVLFTAWILFYNPECFMICGCTQLSYNIILLSSWKKIWWTSGPTHCYPLVPSSKQTRSERAELQKELFNSNPYVSHGPSRTFLCFFVYLGLV
jgi:hypothetical protein